ncbi:hypothetical protein [Clostridium sp.]|uniref:hypothetical protein n=1 Tax=Clostridium sp. TaxID=1506 RepID=UPI003F663D1F
MENYLWSTLSSTTNQMVLATGNLARGLSNPSETIKIISLGKFREILKKETLKNNFKSSLS